MKRLIRPILSIFVAWVMTAGTPSNARVDVRTGEGRSVFDYKHTRWTVEQGAPANIMAMAQTSDGFLWLGSMNGLYRFDGVRFDRVAMRAGGTPLSNGVMALLALKGGALLVGFEDGVLAVLRGGAFTRLRTPLPPDAIRGLAMDADGGVWVAHVGAGPGLAYLKGGRWSQFGPDQGLPLDWVWGVAVTGDGTVVARSRAGLYARTPGARRFTRMPLAGGARDLFLPDGRAGGWVIGDSNVIRVASPLATAATASAIPVTLAGFSKGASVDRAENLWVTTWAAGLVRIRTNSGPVVETMTAAHGLSSDLTISSFVDREDNVWVGGTNGLDQFRTASIIPERRIPAATDGLMIGSAGGGRVFVTDFKHIYRILGGGGVDRQALPPKGVEVACGAPDGSVMLGAGNEFWKLSNGRVTVLPKPPAGEGRHLFHCIVDPTGATWFSAMGDGILKWAGGTWRHYPLPRSMERNWAALMAIGTDGNPLVYLNAGPLVRIDDRGMTPIWSTATGHMGQVTGMFQATDHLLLGGARGLTRLEKGSQRLLSGLDHPWLSSVVGIVETRSGDTWLLTASGLARIRTDVLAAAFDHPKATIPMRMFTYADGLPGASESWGKGNVVEAADGRIWLITSDRAAWIDPSRLPSNRRSPTVSITDFSVDGKAPPMGEAGSLGTGARDVAFRFTATSLTIPERVRFRYRLEGFDLAWRDPGTTREATYMHLGPGSYRFRVIAGNNDGVWNWTGTTVRFVIEPTFVQTGWFLALIGAFVALLAYGAAMLRTRQTVSRERSVLAGKVAERERIARELHDTLLQSVQGLILRFHALAIRVPDDRPERRLMEDALARADEILFEGRERVHALRTTATPYELSFVVRETAQSHLGGELPFTFSVSGKERAVEQSVGLEIQRIASEALFNALKHSGAASVEIDLRFDRETFTMRIADDGRGFDAPTPEKRPAEMHFGLTGMRERAAAIGGTMIFAEGRPKGAVVTLVLPINRLAGTR